MCLHIKKGQKAKIAQEDIVCYKIVEGKSLKSLETFYQYTPVKIGHTYVSELKVLGGGEEVEKGLHSFVNLQDAAELAINWNWECGYLNIYIIECIIPKGSRYYTGDFYGDGYASDKITYVKQIPRRKCINSLKK